METIVIIVAVLIFLGAVILMIVGLRDAKKEDPLQARLAEYAARGEKASLEEIELSQPLSERVIVPLARSIGKLAIRFTPQNAIQSTAHKLDLAGNPRGMDPTLFWASRFILAVGLGVVMMFLFSLGLPGWG